MGASSRPEGGEQARPQSRAASHWGPVLKLPRPVAWGQFPTSPIKAPAVPAEGVINQWFSTAPAMWKMLLTYLWHFSQPIFPLPRSDIPAAAVRPECGVRGLSSRAGRS